MDRLVLWDVDRTLVAVGVGREVYADAFAAVTGRPLEALPDFGGRMDRDLIHETLTAHGVAVTEDALCAYAEAMVRGYAERAAEVRERGRALVGAREALAAFAALDGVVQTVVTGNIRPVAVAKLTAFDLHGPIDFEVGGYGWEDRVRATLVRSAVARSTAKYGPVPLDRVVVIGDTAHDVAAAQAAGVRCIAVATGGTPAPELVAAGADLVLSDLSTTSSIVNFLP